jgi:predicted secreted protein
MANAIAGVGTQFYRWNGDDWFAIAEVRAIVGPSMSKDTVNVTSLDTQDGYNEFVSGFANGGIISLAMSFTRENFELFKTDFEAANLVYYGIMFPDEEHTFLDFSGLVTELPLGIAADDKIDVNVKIQISGVLGDDASSGELPTYETPAIPTDLEVVWADDYAQIDFTDNTAGTAEHEIWSSENGGAYVLDTLLSAGVSHYHNYTWQNSSVTFKVRAKRNSLYSGYSTEVNISTPWVFKMDQATLTQVQFQDLHLYHTGHLVVIHWGDGNTTNVTATAGNYITYNYSTPGQYFVTLTGDLHDINFIQWYSASAQLHGTDISKWRLPTYFEFAHLYSNAFIGDITNMTYPSLSVGCHFGSNDITANITNWQFPTLYWDIHINSNSPYAGITGIITNWVLPDRIAHFQIYGNVTGDMTTVIPFVAPTYPTLLFNFYITSVAGVTGDLSGWTIPDGKEISFNAGLGCKFTKMPRGHFRYCTGWGFYYSYCDQTEIDSFLEYLDDYFTMDSSGESSDAGVAPERDCSYTLSGANMGIPSAAGLVHKASIEAKYAAWGHTVTISVNS